MSPEDPTQVFPKALEEVRRRLDGLEEKVAKRGYDTRPIFEAHERKLTDLGEEIIKLRKRIAGYEKQAAPSIGKLKYSGWAYFDKDGDGPFCRHCYESSKGEQLSHVTFDKTNGGVDEYYCTICSKFSRDIRR